MEGWAGTRRAFSRAVSFSNCLFFCGPWGSSLPGGSPRLQVGRAGAGSGIACEPFRLGGGLGRTVRGHPGSDFSAFLALTRLLSCLLTAHLQEIDSFSFVWSFSPDSQHPSLFSTLQLLSILHGFANITSLAFFWTSEAS